MVSGLSGIYTERGLTQRLTMLLIEYVFTHSGPIVACREGLKSVVLCRMSLLFALLKSNANGWSTAMQMSGKVHAIAHKRPYPYGHRYRDQFTRRAFATEVTLLSVNCAATAISLRC